MRALSSPICGKCCCVRAPNTKGYDSQQSLSFAGRFGPAVSDLVQDRSQATLKKKWQRDSVELSLPLARNCRWEAHVCVHVAL